MQPDKLPRLLHRHFHCSFLALLFAERIQAGVDRALRDIGHRREYRNIVGMQRLVGGAGAASAAADQSYLDRLPAGAPLRKAGAPAIIALTPQLLQNRGAMLAFERVSCAPSYRILWTP